MPGAPAQNVAMTLKPLRFAAQATALSLIVAASLSINGPATAQQAQPAAPAAPSTPANASTQAPTHAATSLASAGNAMAATPGPLKPIDRLDLPRYMGRWHELARYPNRFQTPCTGAATADYRLLPAGTVEVVNRCPRADGSVDEAIGEARRVGPEGSATLQVRFAPAWLSFLPFVWGDYWVVELDDAYQLSIVSEPQREYLWVLSRQPSLPAAQWEALNARLQSLGFEPGRLIRAAAR